VIPVIEQAIRDKLKAAFPQLTVDTFPDDDQAYERLPFHKGVILFAYTDSDFGEPEALGMVVQTQVAQFELHLVVKDLTSHAGAYAHLTKVRELLTGYRAPGAGPLYPVTEKFLSVKQNRWAYGQTWACQLTHSELVPEPDDPPFVHATFNHARTDHTLEIDLHAQDP
jgi:hypothetical protein